MKFIRQILYVLLLIIPALPASAQEEGEKKGVDLQEVLWGHIKDAYHWHIMDIGGEPVVIQQPVCGGTRCRRQQTRTLRTLYLRRRGPSQ